MSDRDDYFHVFLVAVSDDLTCDFPSIIGNLDVDDRTYETVRDITDAMISRRRYESRCVKSGESDAWMTLEELFPDLEDFVESEFGYDDDVSVVDGRVKQRYNPYGIYRGREGYTLGGRFPGLLADSGYAIRDDGTPVFHDAPGTYPIVRYGDLLLYDPDLMMKARAQWEWTVEGAGIDGMEPIDGIDRYMSADSLVNDYGTMLRYVYDVSCPFIDYAFNGTRGKMNLERYDPIEPGDMLRFSFDFLGEVEDDQYLYVFDLGPIE